MKTFYTPILAGLSLALLLSACVVGKKYSRADVKLPSQYRAQAVSVTADTVALPWRTFFQEAQLVALIERALQENNEVSVAMLNVQQTELMYKQAKLGLLPKLNMTANANRTWFSKTSLNGSLSEQFLGTSYLDDYTAMLNLSWEADIWGKVRMQKDEALANYFAQRENLSALKTRIIAQVAQAYYNLIALDEQLEVARRNVALGDSTLRILRLQFEAGQVTSLAIEQAEAQKKTAELLVPAALQNIAIQENALSILCGGYPEGIQRAETMDAAMPEEVFPTGVPALLLSRRPDVKAAEFAVVAAYARSGQAKVAMYPTLSITPSIGINSFMLSSWFNIPGSIIMAVGANLIQPIFQGRALRTAYEVALLEQEKLAANYEQMILVAVGEVSDALARAQYADERLALIEAKTTSLSKASRDAILLYQSGMANYLEVITVQNNALLNELEGINVKREKAGAVIELYRALGGGVE